MYQQFYVTHIAGEMFIIFIKSVYFAVSVSPSVDPYRMCTSKVVQLLCHLFQALFLSSFDCHYSSVPVAIIIIF
jgi:hypothetical protein